MDFTCFHCFKPFSLIEDLIKHLKKIHRIKNNSQDLKCPVNLKKKLSCNKSVRTFDAFKKHANVCVNLKHISEIEQGVRSLDINEPNELCETQFKEIKENFEQIDSSQEVFII